MQSRRRTPPLFTASTPALQPIPTTQETTFNKDVQIEQLKCDLKRLQSLVLQERRYHRKAQKAIIQFLEEQQEKAGNCLAAYIASIALKPGQREEK